MGAKRLTQDMCERAKYPDSKREKKDVFHSLVDPVVQGLMLRITPSNKKTWKLRYRINGKRKELKIADFSALKLSEARKIAQEKLAILARGEDPAKKSETNGKSFLDVCRDFVEKYSKPRKKTWREDQRRIEKHLKPLHKKPIKDLNRADISRIFNKVGADSGHYEANRLLVLISTIFTYAQSVGHISETISNPAKGIRKYPETKRDRWLSGDEWKRFVDSVEDESDVFIKAAILFLLFTGLRKSEVLNLQWQDININEGTIYIRDTKNNEPRIYPPSDQALRVLYSLIPHRVVGGEYVFLSSKRILENKRIADLKCAFKRVLKRAGIENLRIHDLRRSFASMAASNGVNIQVIQRLLGHKNLSTTSSVYSHLADDPVRKGAQEVGDLIDGAVSKEI